LVVKKITHNKGQVPFGINTGDRHQYMGNTHRSPGPGEYEQLAVTLTKPVPLKGLPNAAMTPRLNAHQSLFNMTYVS